MCVCVRVLQVLIPATLAALLTIATGARGDTHDIIQGEDTASTNPAVDSTRSTGRFQLQVIYVDGFQLQVRYVGCFQLLLVLCASCV